MGNKHKDTRVQLNEIFIATNVAHEYYSIEDEPACPQKKLHNSLHHEIDELFLYFETPMNQSLTRNMKNKLFKSTCTEMSRLHNKIISKNGALVPSFIEGNDKHESCIKMSKEYK